MLFEVIVIVCGVLLILSILCKERGTKTPDLLKRYFNDYVPRILEDHMDRVSDYYENNDRCFIQKKSSAPFESKGESECRRVLEKIYSLPFPKVRPTFMNNDVTFHNLEFDCFNEELKIACEYQGEGHFKYIPAWHKTHDGFRNQQYRDYMKKQKCRENNITLIEVPYTIPINRIEDYITEQLNKSNLLRR